MKRSAPVKEPPGHHLSASCIKRQHHSSVDAELAGKTPCHPLYLKENYASEQKLSALGTLLFNQQPIKVPSRYIHLPGQPLHGFRLHHSKALCHREYPFSQVLDIQRFQCA